MRYKVRASLQTLGPPWPFCSALQFRGVHCNGGGAPKIFDLIIFARNCAHGIITFLVLLAVSVAVTIAVPVVIPNIIANIIN